MYLVCLELDLLSRKLVEVIKLVSMILDRILPCIAPLPPIEGNDGGLAINECLGEIQDVVQNGRPDFILVEAVTGCGKSKILPEECALMLKDMKEVHGNLLVLTTAAKDVQDRP